MQLVLGEITVVGNLIGTRADLEDLVMLTGGSGRDRTRQYPGQAARPRMRCRHPEGPARRVILMDEAHD
jgi:hypothetical protein